MMTLKRSECAILSLVLKRKWFEMIAAGKKREEYRMDTKYWRSRLINWEIAAAPGILPVVEFRLGYAKNALRMAFAANEVVSVCSRLYYRRGFAIHPEWGELEDSHFAISLACHVNLLSESEVSQ